MSGSGPDKKQKIPEAPKPVAAAGNLLSSVAPPSQLPNFITSAPVAPAPEIPQHVPQPAPQPVQPVIVQNREEPMPDTSEKFSPAIPLSKGEPTLPIRSPEDSQTTQSPDSLPASTPEVDMIGDIMPGSGLFTWVKGAVSTGGILQRVAEKAKSSVDSMITTLDPQMKEYLKSGGDLYVVVASDRESKVSSIREAFQTVFGRATVVGFPAQSEVTAAQPVGYAAAYAAAKQRIAQLRSERADVTNNVPVVALEGFLHEAIGDKWYDMSLLVLSQPSLGIELQMQSQGTPVAAAAAAAAAAATDADYEHAQTGYSVTIGSIMAASLQSRQHPGERDGDVDVCYGGLWERLLVLSQPSLGIELQMQSQGTPVAAAAAAAAAAATDADYEHAQTGYSVTIGSIMAASLQVHHSNWQEETTGVSRREILLLAARSIAGSYKRLLAVSAAET